MHIKPWNVKSEGKLVCTTHNCHNRYFSCIHKILWIFSFLQLSWELKYTFMFMSMKHYMDGVFKSLLKGTSLSNLTVEEQHITSTNTEKLLMSISGWLTVENVRIKNALTLNERCTSLWQNLFGNNPSQVLSLIFLIHTCWIRLNLFDHYHTHMISLNRTTFTKLPTRLIKKDISKNNEGNIWTKILFLIWDVIFYHNVHFVALPNFAAVYRLNVKKMYFKNFLI